MPRLASSKKDLRRTKKRTTINDRLRVRVKKAIKTFNTFVEEKNVEKATAALPHANKVLGKASKRNVINSATASRKVSRLTKKLNKLITANNVETAKKST